MKIDNLEIAQTEGRAPWSDAVIITKEFIIYRDLYPVTEGHLLFVPRIASEKNLIACFRMANEMGVQNIEADNNITGFNIGMNVGASAGQTCMYPHVHLIYRRDGDCEDPTGGVRNVIEGKGNYKKETL